MRGGHRQRGNRRLRADQLALALVFACLPAWAGAACTTVEWRPPTHNVDGSDLTDLAGYRIYWGSAPGQYSDLDDIDDPAAISYELCAPDGSYYVMMRAIDDEGTMSANSNEVVKVIGSEPGLATVALTWQYQTQTFSTAGGYFDGGRVDVVSPWFQPLRISATVRLDAAGDRQPILSKQGNGERGFLWEVGGANELRAEIWPEGASNPVMVVGPTLQDSVSYEVAVELDGAECRLYVDGLEVASAPTPLPALNSQPVEVGRYFWSSSYVRYFHGDILDLVGEPL